MRALVAGTLRLMDGTTPRRVLQKVVEAGFSVLAALRSARALHARGVVLGAALSVHPGSATADALGGPWTRPAIVRMSKSVGTPGSLPDVLGLALQVPLDGQEVLDVLFATVRRHVLLTPVRGWWTRPYSTLLPYRVDGRLLVLALRPRPPEDGGGADPAAAALAVREARRSFTVTEKPLVGPLREVGTLVLESVPGAPPPITFDPVLHATPRLRPARFLSALREWAYTGSRRGRHAEPDTAPGPGPQDGTRGAGAAG